MLTFLLAGRFIGPLVFSNAYFFTCLRSLFIWCILIYDDVSAYHSRAPEFTPGFSGVRVPQSLVFCVMFCRSTFVLL
jgi:hypothetical protein